MPSLKLSLTGIEIAKQARKEKSWTVDNPCWLEAASEVLEPGRNWENLGFFAAGVSLSTWKRFLNGEPINTSAFKAFCQVLGLNWQELQELVESNPKLHIVPEIPLFFGRGYELAILTKAVEEKTRLLVITGIGGIGKTAVAAKLAEAVQTQFKKIQWFSFHLAPPPNPPPALTPRTLLVFDGWDQILGGDTHDGLHQHAGQYRLGYELYAGFLRAIVQGAHNSCVILTSREQPEGLNALRTADDVVIFPLGRLNEGAIELLEHHKLTFDDQQWIALVNQYGGNPLFLNMAANFIHELFAGDVGEFLASGTIVTGEFEPLVRQWLNHISSVEQILIKFLATDIQGFTREEILLHFESLADNGKILAALLSLKRRALLETMKDDQKERFFLQPVILKCVRRLFN
jgi:hypothetical protein